MKKKYVVTSKDKKDWSAFTHQIKNIKDKDYFLFASQKKLNKTPKIDLHGFSLVEANKVVKKFIIESYNAGYRKVLIVTGKGSRSKSYENPYSSEKLSVLRYSVPEYIKNNENLKSKVYEITKADQKNGGEGAIFVFLKKNFKG